MTAEIVKQWLTYKEAEQLVGLSRTTLWVLISQKSIEYRRIGRAVRISRESLEGYMRGDTVEANQSGKG
ncbi:MAG: helix-turn-helix domain-containing protein [Rubrobacteraceae bacterium]